MIKGAKIVCVDPIEGYLTYGKQYDSQGIEAYAGRVVVTDDNGKEGHFKPERFVRVAVLDIKLTKIESTHSNLRTNEMVGKTGSIPEVGHNITLFGEGLEFGMRVIMTTEVKESTFDKETRIFTFKTQNSTYTLEVLDKTMSDEEIFSFGKYKS